MKEKDWNRKLTNHLHLLSSFDNKSETSINLVMLH